MGKKLDAWLGRSFKTSKFKGTAALAVSRLAVLKNQRQARCSVARSDVVNLLRDGSHDRALFRVEQVIKEQNMLDVFVVLEGYCHLLVERINLFEHEKFCPEELVEAVSTLIYASTRCGDFPELQEFRAIFTSKFGKEFAARAVELRNNCGVNPRIIQKLSTRMPSLETKFKALKEIASDNNIEIPRSETVPENSSEERVGTSEERVGTSEGVPNQEERESSVRRKYRDVADAAQAAFESAAYAAAAARIAVELSRSESSDLSTPREHIAAEILHRDVVAKAVDEMKPNEGKSVLRRSFSASSSDSSDEEGDVKGENVDEFVERNWNPIDSDIGEEKRSEEDVEPLDISRRPISVRTKWARPR